MASIDPDEPSIESRVIGEANPADEDTPKLYGYIAVAITVVSAVIGLALLAGAIYWIYGRF